MAEPIVFVTRHRLRTGTSAGFGDHFRAGMPEVVDGKPGTVLFAAYVDDAGGEVTIVHVFADAAAMDAHLEGAARRAAEVAPFLDPQSYVVYGRPSEAAVSAIQRAAERLGTGATLTVIPNLVAAHVR